MNTTLGLNRVVAPAMRFIGPRRLLCAVALTLFVVVLWRTAWVSDDAYISLRTASNWLDGYGLRWNVDERVQSFTHPLWLALLACGLAVGGNPYYPTLLLGAAASAAGVWLIGTQIARSATAACLAIATVCASRAFIDYATSGLENPLSHLLFVTFALVWFREADRDGDRSLGLATLLVSAAVLTRPDAVLCYAVPWAMLAVRRPVRRTILPVVAGAAPLLCWFAFALVYYGSMLPNTAYAKLASGIPRPELMEQGLRYLDLALRDDPVTAMAILCGVIVPVAMRARECLPLWTGLVAYLAYVVWIGGDFMEGRFLTLPLCVSLVVLLRLPRRSLPPLLLPASGALGLAACIGLTPEPPFGTGRDFGKDRGSIKGRHGIADERRYYFQATGLRRLGAHGAEPTRKGIMRRARKTKRKAEKVMRKRHRDGKGSQVDPRPAVVVVWGASGIRGYYAGPHVHVVDRYGLSDPLLSRMPACDPSRWRIGHFIRCIPDGYERSISEDQNLLTDPALARYYDLVREVSRAPFWSRKRVHGVWKLNVESPTYRAR